MSGFALAADELPFKAHSTGVVTTTGVKFEGGELVEIYTHQTGTGEATRLGRYTAAGDATLHQASQIVTGTWTLTAANGDLLFGTLVGGVGSVPTQGIGTYTVAGGTGRFQGATGSFQQVITFAGPPAAVVPYSDVLEGTIFFGPQ
jgi:hypothetical protein